VPVCTPGGAGERGGRKRLVMRLRKLNSVTYPVLQAAVHVRNSDNKGE